MLVELYIVPIALGHMLMPSAQRCADTTISTADVSMLLILRHQLAATAFKCLVVGFDPTVWNVGICGLKCCILLTCFAYIAISVPNLKFIREKNRRKLIGH